MKTFTALAATTAALLASTVHGHGGMIEPAPRALTTMKLAIDSTFGHPIVMRASYTNGKGGNCLDFTQDTNLKALATGKSKIKMRANDGANHVGSCTAYLVDPRDKSKKVQVGQMNDCMRSLHPGPGNKGDAPIAAEMTIDVPASGLPCDNGHCVLEWDWEASHVSPHELYNNCADVKVGGGGGNPAPAPAPASTTKTPKPAAGGNPQPAPAPPGPAPAPPSRESGKYVYIGPSTDTAGMTQWCNWNCPNFCPSDLCKQA